MAWILGAPVIEPQGNSARTMVAASAPGISFAVTVETMVCSVG